MRQNETVEIYYSKMAYGFSLFGCIIIDLIGLGLMTVTNSNEKWSLSLNPLSKYGLLGVAIITLFSALGWVYIKKLSDNSPALIINNDGIIINNKEPATIGWNKIDHIEVIITQTSSNSSSKNKFIEPVLKNTEEYFDNMTKKSFSVFDKFKIKANTDRPVSISTTFLKCSFDGLKDLLEEKLNDYNFKKTR